jgi:hypothetical protein
VSPGQPTPVVHADSGPLAYPRPYPLPPPESRLSPRTREVAREAILGTTVMVLVVAAAVTAISLSGWLVG